MLLEEGLDNVFARHNRHAAATRHAVLAWGLELVCRNTDEYSSALTAVMMPEGHDADAFRRAVLARYDMSLGMGLGRLQGRVFRIGHLGFLNDLTLCGTLCGVEMGLNLVGAPHCAGGAQAALEFLSDGAKLLAKKNAMSDEVPIRETLRHV